ncbi:MULTISPECIES: MFS transporter [unclassified Halomonas]|uniref:MFS transporter n=1 Tax=unclassified Halomonas TaxID=2609666 RepID=UPI001CF2A07C|nr:MULTISPECIES: MFS transporter [unclassified Halomonas]MCA8865102.1 MFS transporter [Halomonas sp. SBBP1]UZH12076.1 MFS transporter [Halomonas sp. BDJS001]
MTTIRDLLDEEVVEFPVHERSPVPGSPATPTHGAATRVAYVLVAVLVGTTAGLSGALVSVNTLHLQQIMNLSAHQVAWLTTCYVMTAVSANLLLIKVRQQYGLRRFALAFLGLHAILALMLVFVPGLGTALLVRAVSGFVAVALIPLCLFNMMQAFPARWRLRGLVLGIGVTQCAVPLAHVLSPSLLASQGWRSLFLLEAGLALLSLAAVGVLRLPPAERVRVFQPLDLLTFVLMGSGLALIAAVLGLGRWEGWFQAPWIVTSLFIAIPALMAAGAIETSRRTPLLNLRWLGRGDVARFAVAVFMARIVLAEQGIAIGVVSELGGTSQQLAVLSMAILGGAVGGVVISALTVNAEKLARPMMLAVGIIGLAALVDSMSDGSHHLQRFYLTQGAIAFAGTFFLGPALLLGITSALQHGGRELISFIVLFGIVNALGGLAGPALLGSYNDWSRAVGGTPLGASLDTLRLVAVIAGFTTIYLAILLTLRIRRKLAELRTLRDATLTSQTGVADTPIAQERGSRWRPPRPSTALATVFTALALLGGALVLAAWKLPV